MSEFRPSRRYVDERDLCAWKPRAEPHHQQPDDASANNRDAVRWSWSTIPDRVERGLHVGREYGTPRWNGGRNWVRGVRRHREQGLMRMQRKDELILGRAIFETPDGRVAVL